MSLRSSAWAAPFLLAISHSEVHLPSTCIDQEDGLHWLKLMENDDFPVIRQQCDNDYMIIDVNEDPNVAGYFSSYTTWHYALSGKPLLFLYTNDQWAVQCGISEPNSEGLMLYILRSLNVMTSHPEIVYIQYSD